MSAGKKSVGCLGDDRQISSAVDVPILMKIANLVIAILYSSFLAALFALSFRAIAQHPYQPAIILFLAGPVIANWISFKQYTISDSAVKNMNLVAAIAYTVLFALFSIVADNYQRLGFLLLSGPTMLNWMTYFCWPTTPLASSKRVP